MIAKEVAHQNGVSGQRLSAYIERGQVPTNIKHSSLYKYAFRQCRVVYSVHWKNEISAEFDSVSELIDCLETEHSEPKTIRAMIGEWLGPNASISIKNASGTTVDISVKSNLDNVKLISDTLINHIKNSAPDYRVLHSFGFKVFLIVCLVALGVTSTFRFGMFVSQTFGGDQFWMFFPVVICFFSAGLLVPMLYQQAFPAAVFQFGAGKKQASQQKIVLWTVGLIVSLSLGYLLAR